MKYRPHEYQQYAIEYIETHPVSAVLLDMGLGKTSITLTALQDLLFDRFEAHKVLIIAPLRVARNTWPAELQKWDHLQDLAVSVVVGNAEERKAALAKQADLYVINREMVQWLVEQSGYKFDFDTVVIDELSSFKNHQSKRFKALMKVRPKVKRIIVLTGTPSSNGLMDLWAEFRLLDMGERLGRYITQYRTKYFMPDKRNAQIVFSYKPLPGAEEQIYDKISDIYCKYYEVVFILFHTGMRISEFCGLTICDLDMKNRIINIDHQLQRIGMTIHVESTKTNAGTRKIPMTEDVYRCFQGILEDRETPTVEKIVDGYSGFLFLDKEGFPEVAMHWEHRFNHMVKRYNEIYRVQIPNITPHVCRHTYCSNMARAGMNPKTLQYLMGHSDIGVTMNTYTHLGLEDAQNEMIRLEELNRAKEEVAKAAGEQRPVTKRSFRAV